MMDRREFLKKSFQFGLAAGAGTMLGGLGLSDLEAAGRYPDLVAVRNGTPEAMFASGIAAIGGMSRFVRRGQKVVVKPNIGWNSTPELGANTDPGLVKAVVAACFAAGASQVTVFDNTCNYWKYCYTNSGIEKAARDANAKIAPGNREKYYQTVRIPGAKVLKTTAVHEAVMEADVLINVPILKNHSGAGMTAALKNLMGVVWDRRFYHRTDLQTCIAEFALFKKPTLNVIDAYRVMYRHGPRGISRNDLHIKKMQIISPDIVAADTAALRIMGMNTGRVSHIAKAAELHLGEADLNRLHIKRIVL